MAAVTIQKTSKVTRWGNSLGFRIPQEGVDRLKLKEGESVCASPATRSRSVAPEPARNGPKKSF